MKREIKELKRIARGNLQGHYMDLIRVIVFCNVVVSLIEIPFSMMTNNVQFSMQNIIYYVASILISIASVVLTAGQQRLHLQLARTGEIHLSEFFIPMKVHADRFILTELILFGLSIVCMIPMAGAIAIITLQKDTTLYVVAIILAIVSLILMTYLSLTFNLLYFVMNDNDQLSTMKALKYTKNMIKTHRGRYFYMLVSFLGMMLLGAVSLGIGMLWIQPYMVQTTTLFYLEIKGELNEVVRPVTFDSYA